MARNCIRNVINVSCFSMNIRLTKAKVCVCVRGDWDNELNAFSKITLKEMRIKSWFPQPLLEASLFDSKLQ